MISDITIAERYDETEMWKGDMENLKVRTRGNASPQGKPRVYFTCHPADFSRSFDKICEDILKICNCAIYYTQDVNVQLPEETRTVDLERMNLFVISVSFRLLSTPNRAMEKLCSMYEVYKKAGKSEKKKK